MSAVLVVERTIRREPKPLAAYVGGESRNC
jgi:hypothetical protein